MKNFFTCMCSHRRFLLVTVVALMSHHAFAGDEGFFNYWVHLGSYPTGAGKVYAEIKNGSVVAENAEFGTPAESVEVKYTKKDNASQAFDAYAVPAEGGIVAGFTYGTKDENGAFTVKADTLIKTDNPASLSPKSTSNDKDSLTAVSIFPLEADTAFYAVFTHVAPRLRDGQEEFGKVSIDKISNNIGDKVTLTAIANEAGNGKFAYWVEKSTGNKLTDNPLTVDVTKAEEYFAYFESDLMENVTFPEGGGWLPFHTDCYVLFPSKRNFAPMLFNGNGMTKFDNNGKDAIACVPEKKDVWVGIFNSTYLLYGTGDYAFKRSPDNINPESNENFLRWSGDEGVKVDTLQAGHHYYLFDANNEVFNIVTETNIAAKQVYMAMPDSCVEKLTPGNFPDVIYISENPTTGISTVNTATPNVKRGIYTLEGRKVEAMEREGIYIYDGKKVLYRKK